MKSWILPILLSGLLCACSDSGSQAGPDRPGDAWDGDSDGDSGDLDAGDDSGGDVDLDGRVGDDGDAGDDSGDAGDGDGGDPGDSGAEDGDGDGGDPGSDAGADDGGDREPIELTRGQRWVRDNPMFISAITVSMGPPPAAFVNAYYDDFHATATHLWQDGLPNEVNGWAAAGRGDFRFLSWVQANGRSGDGGQIAGGYSGTPPGRIGYQIGDEPGLGCNDTQCALDDLYEMQAGLDAVRAHDPDALIFVNFYMSSYIDDLLAYYTQYVDGDLIQYDRYARDKDAYEALEIFRRAGLDSKRPYWRYLRSFVYQDNLNNPSTPSDMRWDAMAGLVYGFTGHTWFIYTIDHNTEIEPVLFDAENDYNAQPTALWHVAAQLNTEMRHLGRAITQLTSTDVRYIPINAFLQPLESTNWAPGAGGDPYLSGVASTTSTLLEILIGFFQDDAGEYYFMAQNVSHDGGLYPNNVTDTETIRLSFDFSSAPQSTSRTSLMTLDKQNGQVESIPLTQHDGTTGYLDVTLEAGDAILLKYDTGAPFALQP